MPRSALPLRTVLVSLLVVAAVVAAGFAALVGLVWWSQERIVFQPPGAYQSWEGGGGETFARVRYRAADGQELFAHAVLPAASGTRAAARPQHPTARGVVIVFHGNADLASAWEGWALRTAERTGWAVLVAEYRGYGGLPGVPTYEGSKLDARAAYAFARDSMGARPEQVAIYGHSLGSAIGAELAAEVRPRALLLESPLTSARAMARRVVGRPVVAFWPLISRVHYDTEARVRALDVPVHVAHGDRDGVIPVHMGRAVHAAARVKGALLVVRGAGHNDVAAVAGEEYWRWVAAALGAPE